MLPARPPNLAWEMGASTIARAVTRGLVDETEVRPQMNIKTARHSQSAKNASESSSMLTLLELNHVETLHRGIMCAARHHILTFVDGDLDGHVLDSRTEHPFEREVVQVILSATNG